MKLTFKRVIGGFVPKVIKSALRQFAKSDPYKGNNVDCAVCHSQHARFAPYGSPERENARCPNCGSLERHRLLWSYLQNRSDFFANKNVKLLHFAPEKSFYNKFMSMSNVDYSPCDLFPEVFKFDKQKKIIKVDITSIPFPNDHFDVILCNHVLEHIPDDRRAMSELYRILKKGGWGIFQVPIDYNREKTYEDFSITSPEERKAAFGQDDHVRLYGKDYKDRLHSAGFLVNEDDYVVHFSSEEIARFGFMRHELIYQCKKE